MAVDITDPGQPVAISTLPGLPDVKYGHRMALRSEYLYAASDSGILIIDVQDPANISLAGVYPLEKTAYMTIKDSLLLVTKGLSPYSPENGLHILNISTPQSPVKIGAYTQWAGARLMDVKQNYAFIETICILGRPACNALSIVDITAPTAPLEIGRKDSIFSDSHGDMGDLNVTNDWAYHTFTSTRIIYIHDPQSPVVISKIEGLFAMDVCLASPRGDIIYVGHGPGISIYRNNETTFIDQKPEGSIVSKLNLKQNYPNPFNNTTNIAFSLPRRDHAVLKIYDITGKEVITLVNKELSAGEHTTTWTGINDTGKKVSSGLYIYKLKLRYSEVSQVKKLLFLK
ncbi:MAG: T9SS type A sorting domain-containing protein [candidate division Zixibacteria bacterium]|nr:T9SS type A sorting domain-containing protein [candidate division Zixibacteria bacterium]